MTFQTRPRLFTGRSRRDGEIRTVTTLVCGLRGLNELASSFRDDPSAFMQFVERVWASLTEEVTAHRGTIERMSGEGFSAFWDDPDHAVHACEAANAILQAASRLTATLSKPIAIGIGIATGSAITGAIHVHGRAVPSAVGECATAAMRAQALSETYSTAVIATDDTRRAAKHGFGFLEVDYIALDEGAPVRLYAMIENPAMRASPTMRALTTFHDHIFQAIRDRQWTKARALIDQCRKLSGASQPLYDLHLSRIARYEVNPPGADWDGAFRPVLK